MSYDVYVFESVEPRPTTPRDAQVRYETLLLHSGTMQATGHVLDFLRNLQAVRGIGVETHIGASGVVVHLRSNDDAGRTNVALLASLSGLYGYDPQAGHLTAPARRDGI